MDDKDSEQQELEEYERLEQIIHLRREELSEAVKRGKAAEIEAVSILFKDSQIRWLISYAALTKERAYVFMKRFEDAGGLSRWLEDPQGLPPSVMSLFRKE